MASKGGLLSDLQLKQWIEAGKPLSMTDGGGLIFTLSAAGNAAWVLRYRHGTRRPEMTLGPYPAISLSEAWSLSGFMRLPQVLALVPVSKSTLWRSGMSSRPQRDSVPEVDGQLHVRPARLHSRVCAP